MNKPEILSPCGGPESVAAAVNCGADAVYLGAEKFSARRNAVNFSAKELEAAVRECHRNGVSVYLTMNTVLLGDELEAAAELLKFACEIGIDGIILQDLAVYEMAKTSCPDMPLHASTQMSLHTPYGATAAKSLGFKRIVAARELSLKDLKELCNTGIEVEAFAHGALCMCVSGQCYLSAMIGGRSANRGLCAGACRLPFSAAKRPTDVYALSLKDMSYAGRAGELAEAGVASLKIEGRMKRAEYVAAATDALRKALDGEIPDYETLRAVFSRSGFTDGYLDGKTGGEMFGARLKEDVVAAAEALPKLRKLYEKPRKRFGLTLEFTAKRGEPIRLEAFDGSRRVVLEGDVPEEAKTRETTSEEAAAQLSKLGGTIYFPEKIEAKIDGGLSIPLSKINELRRRAAEELDGLRAESYPKRKFDGSGLMFDFPTPLIRKRPAFRIRVEKISQLSKLPLDGEKIVIPFGTEKEYLAAGHSPENAVISLPRFDTDEKNTVSRLKFAKSLGFKEVEYGNIGQLTLAKDLGLVPHGGFGLNVTNSLAARHHVFGGAKSLVLSPELKAWQLGTVSCPAETGAILYGRLPLMITRNCPIAAEVGCKNCRQKLTDRTGAEFKVICRRERGVFEITNSRPLWLADRIDDFNLDFGDLWFTDETPEEAARVLRAYRSEVPPTGEFTRGLYYRGII